MPVALLLLEEERRHEPRGLAAKVPLVLLLLLRGGQRQTRELAAEVCRLFCCCWLLVEGQPLVTLRGGRSVDRPVPI